MGYSETEQFLIELDDLTYQILELQFLCASATVGQTTFRQLQSLLRADSVNKAVTLVSGTELINDDLSVRADARRVALMPQTLENKYLIIEEHETMPEALFRALDQLPPAPTIVFAHGKAVKQLTDFFICKGITNVQKIRDWRPPVLPADNPNVARENPSWATTPIYVGTERDARGLDMIVDYVFLTIMPRTPAQYAHLAGRT